MEGRKLQKVGYSTFTISLPAAWIKQTGLKKGDVVIFRYEKDGSLRLMPIEMVKSEKKAEHVAINLDLHEDPKLLERLIVGCYILGYKTITISSQGKIHGKYLSAIRNATFRLAGLSIMDEKPNVITLYCSVDPTTAPLITMVRRLFTITITMYNEVLEALSDFNFSIAKEVLNREFEADMLYWLILRIIILSEKDASIAEKVGVKEMRHLLSYRVIVKDLESVGDYLASIAEYLTIMEKKHKKPSKNVANELHRIGEIALKIFSDAFEGLVNEDLKKANKSIEEGKKFEAEEEENVNRIMRGIGDPETAAVVRCISRAFQMISDYGISIAHVAINRYVEKPGRIITILLPRPAEPVFEEHL